MPGYVIAHLLEVTDQMGFDDFRARVEEAVERHGGRYLAGTDELESLQGDLRPLRSAIIEFPSFDQAKAWYVADDYRELRDLQVRSAPMEIILVQGD